MRNWSADSSAKRVSIAASVHEDYSTADRSDRGHAGCRRRQAPGNSDRSCSRSASSVFATSGYLNPPIEKGSIVVELDSLVDMGDTPAVAPNLTDHRTTRQPLS